MKDSTWIWFAVENAPEVFVFFPSAHSPALYVPLRGPTVPQLVNSIVLLSYISRSEKTPDDKQRSQMTWLEL